MTTSEGAFLGMLQEASKDAGKRLTVLTARAAADRPAPGLPRGGLPDGGARAGRRSAHCRHRFLGFPCIGHCGVAASSPAQGSAPAQKRVSQPAFCGVFSHAPSSARDIDAANAVSLTPSQPRLRETNHSGPSGTGACFVPGKFKMANLLPVGTEVKLEGLSNADYNGKRSRIAVPAPTS